MTPNRQGFRFPKQVRLRRQHQFQRLWQSGRKYHTPHFIILVAPSDTERPRLGLTVSRKVGKAVLRNRIKRLVREIFRHRLPHLPPIDLSVVARSKASFDEESLWLKELDSILDRLCSKGTST